MLGKRKVDIRKGGILIPKAEAAAYRINPGKELITHDIDENFINMYQITITSKFPAQLLAGNEVLSLVRIADNGLHILLQRPKDIHLCPEDWTKPGSAEDWEIVGGKLISYKHCLKINQCSCIYSLLQTCFRDSVYSTLGWQLQEEPLVEVVGLRIINTNNR
jgi:hypothetical protein